MNQALVILGSFVLIGFVLLCGKPVFAGSPMLKLLRSARVVKERIPQVVHTTSSSRGAAEGVFAASSIFSAILSLPPDSFLPRPTAVSIYVDREKLEEIGVLK